MAWFDMPWLAQVGLGQVWQGLSTALKVPFQTEALAKRIASFGLEWPGTAWFGKAWSGKVWAVNSGKRILCVYRSG